MHFVVLSKPVPSAMLTGLRVGADGEMISFEQPWSFGAPVIALVDDGARLDAIRAGAAATPGLNAFAVEGLEEPGSGQAYVLGGHIMRDMERFKPYAAAVPEVLKSHGGRFLVRGGKVTPIAGSFVPERVVLIEFANAEAALDFYVSDDYAPLLKIRLTATEARAIIQARSGDLPASVHVKAAAYLRGHR